MPLKVQLKKDQKVIVNGAVLENISPRTVSFLVMNEAAILRESDIMTEEKADTPARRVYFAAQCLYLFPAKKAEYLPLLNVFMDNYLKAAPSADEVVSSIKDMVAKGDLYHALKKTNELIAHEEKALTDAENRFA